MSKYCPSCGAELTEGAKFCLKCGAKVDATTTTSKQPQSYQPMAQLGKNNKIMFSIIAIIVAIIVVVAIVLLVFLGGNNTLVGKWSIQPAMGGQPVTWTVYQNNTAKQEYTYYEETHIVWGHWEIKGNQLCGYWDNNPSDYRCIKIEFSEGGNQIMGYYNEELYFTGTRIR